jgi:hypothetical protein
MSGEAPVSARSRLATLREATGVWKALAVAGLTLAGLTGLGYSVWVITARRGIFSDIAQATYGPGAVSLQEARSSDAVDSGWLWATTVLLGTALLLWAVTWLVERTRLGPIGFAGLSMIGFGLLVVVVGSLLASLVDGDPQQAVRAVAGYSLIGAGFMLVSLGLLTGVVSLYHPQPGEETYLGYAGWGSG